MRRTILTVALCALAFGLGIALMHWRASPDRTLPDEQTVVSRMREVAQLETLELSVYKKISFEPDPQASDSLWGAVVTWAKTSLAPSRGKAIVFATVHVGLSLDALDPEHVQIVGSTARIVLPPLKTRVELLPGETEVIRSNLDSAQTAQLLQLAKEGFEREVAADPKLQLRARESGKRALTGLLLTLGFEKVEFVDALPRSGTN